jgi:hypothetical protein
MDNVLRTRIDDLEFSTRVHNALGAMKVETVFELVQMTESELMRSPNLGRKSLFEIKDTLAGQGLTLGLKFDLASEESTVPYRASKTYNDYVRESTARRVRFLENASRSGLASADVLLGRMYLEGLGVDADFRKARHYFVRAARRGNRLGFWNLAVMYRIGYGVRRSEAKVVRWVKAWEIQA